MVSIVPKDLSLNTLIVQKDSTASLVSENHAQLGPSVHPLDSASQFLASQGLSISWLDNFFVHCVHLVIFVTDMVELILLFVHQDSYVLNWD